jgi:hypothetical protein
VNWVVVNMPWRITRSTDAERLGQEFIAAVNAAKETWRKNNPDAFQLHGGGDLADEAIAIQDDYPWVKGILDAASAEEWRDIAIRQLPSAPVEHQDALKALILHRYFYRLESEFINNDAEVIRTQNACAVRRELEKTMDFVHHPDCQVGVQIEILSEGQTKKLLIGDIVPSGMDSGCCQDGIRDEDIVVRYRDLRSLLKEQDV